MAVIGTPPVMPLRMRWGELRRTYESLDDAGTDLEFVEEHEFFQEDQPKPYFWDAEDRRFRILVISLQVVLCVSVPADYDPRRLALGVLKRKGKEIVIESYEGLPHRGVDQVRRVAVPASDLSSDESEFENSTAPSLVLVEDSYADWLDFESVWFASVDPAPPVAVGSLVGRFLRLSKRRN